MTYGRETRDTKKAVRERVKGIGKPLENGKRVFTF
jgi:hypothetical protein